MQEDNPRRSNKARTEAMRAKLIKAARNLFVEKGYAETGTTEIVATASVTRGALYHHFSDKADLFRAVLEVEAQAVAKKIDQESTNATSPFDALMQGAEGYFAAMKKKGRTRLLLIDGPSILGPEIMSEIDRNAGEGSLRDGLVHALPHIEHEYLDALTALLSAAFDRAALAIAQGEEEQKYRDAIGVILKGIVE